jgi:cold-inducible RNA-binding protein
MARRVYAGNLNFDLTDAGLRAVFARVGGVEQAVVMRDRWTGLSRGFGFVDMMTSEDAEAAIGELNGTEVMGRILRAAPAKPRENGSPQGSPAESRYDQ